MFRAISTEGDDDNDADALIQSVPSGGAEAESTDDMALVDRAPLMPATDNGDLPAAIAAVAPVPGTVSSRTCAINIIKCAVGAGSFNVPFAFYQEGLVGGCIGTVAMGALAAYTIILLARAEKHVVQQWGAHLRFTFPEVARALTPRLTVKGVNGLEVLIYAGMVLLSIGVCAIYAVFILSTLPGVFGLARSYVAMICGALILGLALVRTYAWLAVTSVLGDLAVASGLIATVAYGLDTASPSLSHGAPLLHFAGVPQASATIAFLFLIHAVVLPMAQSLSGDLARPQQFERVVVWSMALITAVNLFFGVICVLIFGKDTKQNIIDNLGTSVFVKIVSVLLCVDLLFTVPMVLAFGREILEKSLFDSVFGRRLKGRRALVASCVLRTLLVAIIMTIALSVIAAQGGLRAFGNLINLVGGVVSSLLGLILPPVLYVQTLRAQRRLTRVKLALLAGISALGTALLLSSTYYTMQSF